jgi:large subunit ribosomal protein L16
MKPRKSFSQYNYRRKILRHLTYRTRIRVGQTPPLPLEGGIVLRAAAFGLVSEAQLEAMRKIIRRSLRKRGIILYYSQPFVSLTAKPLAVRMGKGKGAIANWFIPCIPGKMILKIYGGVSEKRARHALRTAARKLSFKTHVTYFNPLQNVRRG